MKKTAMYGIAIILAIVIVGAGAYWFLQSNEENGGNPSNPSNPANPSNPGQNYTNVKEYIFSLPYQNLSAQEIQGLQYMREEEKLAHDVYAYAYDKYGLKIFNNIASSESMHTYMVSVLLEKYNLTDPAKDEPRGVFKNRTLQELYYKLIGRVNQSEEEALIVGANIEELDIVDINHWKAQTDNQDIEYVYSQLINGSANHLRAFVSTLEKMYNYTYKPVYLSQEEYDRIINGGNP